MSDKLNRRTILAGAAVLPALSIPAIAAASTEPDPTFAVIATHREAFMKRMRADRPTASLHHDDPKKEELDAALTAAFQTEHDAIFALSKVVPTTMGGVIALLRYLEEFAEQAIELPEEPEQWCSGYQNGLFENIYEHATLLDKFSGQPLEVPFTYCVMQNVRVALESLAVVQSSLEDIARRAT
jgi:hypothetical protein